MSFIYQTKFLIYISGYISYINAGTGFEWQNGAGETLTVVGDINDSSLGCSVLRVNSDYSYYAEAVNCDSIQPFFCVYSLA